MKLDLILIPRVASLFMRLLHSSLRVRHVDLANMEDLNVSGRSYILSFWHCYILLMVFSRFRKPMTVMISKHRDGELIARTMDRFGIGSARGSSSRGGGSALRELVGAAARGENIAFTPDGPRGPARVAQLGVAAASQRTSLPVIPVALISERPRRLRSWDRFEIPRPFSRAFFIYGRPLQVPADAGADELAEWREKIEQEMNELSQRGEENFDQLWREGVR